MTPADREGNAVPVALVGAGLICDMHVAALRGIDGVRVAAIVDADLARAEAKAAAHGVAHAFATQLAMLAAVRPHVVHLLTPPATHAALCIEALEGGADVYVEKPMATSVADCDRMIEAAERLGRRLGVGHSLAFDPLLARAQAAIDRGDIGEVVHADASFCFDPARIPGYRSKAWYRRLDGGFEEDLAAHPASVLLRLIGPVRSVHAVTGRGGGGIAAVIDGERASGALFVSLDARPEDVALVVRGTRGLLTVNFSTMVVSVQRASGLPRKIVHGVRNLASARDHLVQTFSNTARYVLKRVDTTKGVQTLIRAFHASRVDGTPLPVAPGEGREVVRVMRALWPERQDGGHQEEAMAQRAAAAAGGFAAGQATPPFEAALVTGAGGFIGTHLVRLLAGRGVRVRALVRDRKHMPRLAQPGVEVVVRDLEEPQALEGLADGCATVFHLASVMRGSDEEFERIDIASTRRLVKEAQRAGVRRFVFTSTMGAYALGELRDGAVVTEAMTDDPSRVGPYARTKLLIERMLAQEHASGAFETVVLRPGLVFGPGNSPFLEHLPHLGSLKGDRYVVFGDGEVPLQLTYVENTVDALWQAAVAPKASGGTFTIVDDDLPVQREFVARLADLTGRPLRLVAIPRAGAWVLGAGIEALAAAARKRPPTTRRLLLGKTVKFRFDTSAARELLGWTPTIGWQEGLRRSVEAAALRRAPAPVPQPASPATRAR